MNKWLYRLILCLCLIGIGIQLYPMLRENKAKETQKKEIQIFTKSKESKEDSLYTQMQEYNERIFQENQSGLKDVFSYEQNPFDLSVLGLDDDMIGYIEIEKLNLNLPLYIGANNDNMRDGAAVLAETSMPVGGNNTNCAIAAHRGGANGDQSFKNIEQLETGDEIRITNAWETLTYVVAKQIVIEPNDVGAIKIIPGQDMLTLITCHPYGYNSHRYVVYAQRKGVEQAATLPESIVYESSVKEIEVEQKTGVVALGCSVLITFVMIVVGIKDKFRRK